MSQFIITDSLKTQRIEPCPKCGHHFYIRIQFLDSKKKGWRCTNCGEVKEDK